ncbi:secretory pathway protein Pga2 (predicted) [Sugiyamaella lignohabitans]|uniref:Secretory pathway protein Pga2 (Predicted) n=1 Tax=Sugiyamaella lignohabitans TaxID=796027 RepID=A0A161HMS3_9ASCO|nr:secretory pathway protein Pga2 (predicted) [Sugiyamaella lignohabitans]ANB15197.1 secretory pathway protein Pga2 (predicted) [Sugiyamaella lignohabitans]
MALFGFPENFSDYSAKHYLRIVIIICIYLVLRPHLVKFGERIQEKRAAEAASKIEAEGAGDESSATGVAGSDKAGLNKRGDSKKVTFVDDMESDEDVSDLLE